jgi:quercetin dioxygenase-like cupin family protein
VSESLAKNPIPEDAEAHLTPLFHGDAMTLILAQIKGTVKPHIHSAHEETIYVVRGKGRALAGGEWQEISAGTVLHFKGQVVHTVQAEPGDPLVFLCHFAPGMKEMDRVFVD